MKYSHNYCVTEYLGKLNMWIEGWFKHGIQVIHSFCKQWETDVNTA